MDARVYRPLTRVRIVKIGFRNLAVCENSACKWREIYLTLIALGILNNVCVCVCVFAHRNQFAARDSMPLFTLLRFWRKGSSSKNIPMWNCFRLWFWRNCKIVTFVNLLFACLSPYSNYYIFISIFYFSLRKFGAFVKTKHARVNGLTRIVSSVAVALELII